MLVARALGIRSEDLVRGPEQRLSDADAEALSGWVARREAREPLGRIAGEREFYGRTFRLSAETLEPRPDSETLIDTTLALARGDPKLSGPLRIIDIGTGTGCLLLTLLAELPNATGVGTDVSAGALEVAVENSERLGLAGRAAWRQARGLAMVDETFDIMVSNPPYIPSAEIAGLPPEVRWFDPRTALDGGEDGLELYREIAGAWACVVPEGLVVLEVGAGMADDVVRLFAEGPHRAMVEKITLKRDLAGHLRCVAVQTRRRK